MSDRDRTSRALSPLDGRYGERLAHLGEYFSEFALMRARCRVELLYLEALDGTGLFPPFDGAERARITDALASFGEVDFGRIKQIELTTRHDVKACELYLRERLSLRNPNLIHLGLTSEDVNNLAYSLLLRSYVEREQLKLLDRLLVKLCDLAERWKEAPFPARTHGQLASPTTAGKELAVFVARLLRHRRALAAFRFRGKLAGATGNYSALAAVFPDHDWPLFSRRFVQELGLGHNPVTTQIEDHDTWADHFNLTRQVNAIVLDLDVDLWLYISHGYFREAPRSGQVGSSTMPHKVNPIRFENSEGNGHLSNALLSELAGKLTRSRMQRDLSDSTVSRNIGVALAHAHLAWEEALAGLGRIELDRARCLDELERSPELLAEPIQTALRVAGVGDPYEKLRLLTQGRSVTRADLDEFLDRTPIPDEVRARLKALSVRTYVGLAARLCEETVAEARAELAS